MNTTTTLQSALTSQCQSNICSNRSTLGYTAMQLAQERLPNPNRSQESLHTGQICPISPPVARSTQVNIAQSEICVLLLATRVRERSSSNAQEREKMCGEMSGIMPQGLLLLYESWRISWGCTTHFNCWQTLTNCQEIQINSYLHEYMLVSDDRQINPTPLNERNPRKISAAINKMTNMEFGPG